MSMHRDSKLAERLQNEAPKAYQSSDEEVIFQATISEETIITSSKGEECEKKATEYWLLIPSFGFVLQAGILS